MKKSAIALVLGLSAFGAAPAMAAPAEGAAPDVIFYNGKIVTLNPAQAAVDAVAVKDEKFMRVGKADVIRGLAGASTELIDLGGRLTVPGLIDAHTHPMETIMMKEGWVDARYPATPSVKQALANLAAWVAHTPKGSWIFVACVSASENKFEERRLPTKAELDGAAPENPVILANGTHMAIANSMGLRALGVTPGNAALKGGGRALLDKNGDPTGTLTDAMGAAPTTPSVDELKKYYTSGIQDLWKSYGFTSIMAITPAAALPVLQAVALKVRPDIRYTVSVWTAPDAEGMPANLDAFRMPPGANPAYYRFAAIKAWMDGENDARTGLMYESYLGHFDTDPPGDKGSLVTPPAQARLFADIANRNGVIAMLHCSGDKATDYCLDAYEHEVATRSRPSPMRIEHFGMFQLSEEQLGRAIVLKKKGLSISVQPTWLLDLVKADVENSGEKLARSGFKFRTMIDAGLEPAAGTDVTGIYLTNVNPMLAIYASVTRASDMGAFEPKEAVSVTEALKMWTIWAARAMGEENIKGSIEVGKYADMTVLSDDLFTMPAQDIKDVRVLKTIVGGRVVYEAR
jgi:predicted amidohydrolase YtcJ